MKNKKNFSLIVTAILSLCYSKKAHSISSPIDRSNDGPRNFEANERSRQHRAHQERMTSVAKHIHFEIVENKPHHELTSLFSLKKHTEIKLKLNEEEFKEHVKEDVDFFSKIEKSQLLVLTQSPQKTLTIIKNHYDLLKKEHEQEIDTLNKNNSQKKTKLKTWINQINEENDSFIQTKINSIQKEKISSNLKECSEKIGCEVEDITYLSFTQNLLEYFLLLKLKNIYDMSNFYEKDDLKIQKEDFNTLYQRSYELILTETYIKKLNKSCLNKNEQEETKDNSLTESYDQLKNNLLQYELSFEYEKDYLEKRKNDIKNLTDLNHKIEETKKKYFQEAVELGLKTLNPNTKELGAIIIDEINSISKNIIEGLLKKTEKDGSERAIKERLIIKE